jgi:hypothetical protein
METPSRAAKGHRPSKRPPWKRANPKPKPASKKLSAAAKAKARARAQAAGRRYPNLVDNMWAARTVKP